MVHGQIDGIKAILHDLVQPDSLFRCLEICYKHRMIDKILALETIKAGKERIRRGESADVDVGTPGLPENPVKQTERMKSDAKI